MKVIHKELLDIQGSQSTFLIEVENNNAHSYNDRFKIIVSTNDDQVLIEDIFCYNGSEDRYDCVTNLLSPKIFNELI
ncbi:hypothetical protein CIB95_08080 [Lottiidibacillus patelloidae]|uniref:Uncharacterized protein n=1 Tax=Lottiidibacillus patelloidae TaxID=2670334 RepID=A0A263BV14_9BACI|nr:hypothetical protein [Lottiidibacillus patelloidae]OZM57408.1 hypothetical protein CIB95_08080 [Lottiidibacillus patelloidae]